MITLFNSSISTNYMWEEYEKTVNSIYLHTLAKDTLEFTGGQIETLYNLALQCPLEGGQAVLKARALYALVNDTIDYADECSEGSAKWDGDNGETKIENKLLLPEFFIYPNPTENTFMFEYRNVTQANVKVRLFDAQGKLLEELMLNGGQQKHLFNGGQYNSGIIQLRVAAVKVIVQH